MPTTMSTASAIRTILMFADRGPAIRSFLHEDRLIAVGADRDHAHLGAGERPERLDVRPRAGGELRVSPHAAGGGVPSLERLVLRLHGRERFHVGEIGRASWRG